MRSAVLLVFLVGCKITSTTPAIDGSELEPTYDSNYVHDASCLADSYDFVGGLIDFEYTEDSGIAGAQLVVRSDTARTAVTSATGSFTLCAPVPAFVADVDAPGDYLDGLLVVVTAVDTSNQLVAPAFTGTRIGGLFARFGQTYDPNLGQVVVVQKNALAPLSLTGAGGTPLTNREGPWIAGDDGQWILFPNVALGTQTLSRSLGWTVAMVPVEAGKITWVPSWYFPR